MIKKHVITMMFILLIFSFVYPINATSLQTAMILKEENNQKITLSNFNNPPDPPLISGPTDCVKGAYYDYQFTLLESDPDDFLTLLEVDFGNQIKQSIPRNCELPWYNGTIKWMTHSWQTKGGYDIKARVMDSHGEWSNWSEPYPVTLKKQKSFPINLTDFIDMFPFLSFFRF